jgi:hypothetical protein
MKEDTMKRFRRAFAAVATLAAGVLTLAAGTAAPAYAMHVPQPGEHGLGDPGTPVYVTPVHVIAEGGMPGWQITLIAVGAALVAAGLAVLLDRAWTARKTRTSTA